ncbi:MAG TPA: metallopeptidase TldD-related protein, partial [Myxococcaceae bacterium]|nr:metallopeptidase TldD-related protein [Myxococcaceae bacterium]
VAADKAVLSSHPRRLEPGRYTVVLEPAAVGELLAFLTNSLGARPADEGRSFFARKGGTRLGEKLFADGITLRSDPTSPALPSAPFDREGHRLEPITWVENGKLSALAYSRFWAAKQGKVPTGHHTSYLLEGGDATREGLLTGVKRGVLITRFWYTRWVDPQSMLITGLTRDGVFLIEDGKLAGPVNNFRFNESPVTMLANADALTKETVRVPGGQSPLRVPALRTHGFNLASVSDAI